jgi:AcrR family transcriptional regulator
MPTVRVVRRTRVEQRAQTRRRLLEAAGRVFARRGYEAAAVEEIAEEAGFTRGAVYSNFRDKDDLFVAYLRERMDEEGDELRATIQAQPDLAGRLAAARARYVSSHCKDTAVLYAELQLAAARHPDLRRKLRPLFEQHVEKFARIAWDVHGDLSPAFRSHFLVMFAALEGIVLLKASGHADDATAERALGDVFDAMAPLLAPRTAT